MLGNEIEIFLFLKETYPFPSFLPYFQVKKQ